MKGFIKVSLLVVSIFLIGLAAIMLKTDVAQARTIPSQTFILPSNVSVTHSANTYIIIWDVKTGNLVDDNGAIAAGNTWTGGDIATGVHAQNGVVFSGTMPPLSDKVEYGMAIFDSASPAKTDVPTMGPFLYSARSVKAYTDTNLGSRGSTFVMERLED